MKPSGGSFLDKIKNVFGSLLKKKMPHDKMGQSGTIVSGKRPVPPRAMKFPYTFAAKVVQFPVMFYVQNGWFYRYFLYGTVASWPFFYYFGQMSYSENNVAVWEEIRRREFTPGLHH